MKPKKLYHVTTHKKAKLYKNTGSIIKPVRGFDSLKAAMLWAIKAQGRQVILEIDVSSHELEVHKLPDHHNEYGSAWWIDTDISSYKRIISEGN